MATALKLSPADLQAKTKLIRRDIIISNPLSATVQPIASSLSGIKREPEAATFQAFSFAAALPTIAAAPSAKIALATNLSASLP